MTTIDEVTKYRGIRYHGIFVTVCYRRHFLLPHIPRFASTIMQWRERLRHAELTSFISPPLQHDTTVKVSTFSLTRARRCIHYWQVAPEIASSATNQPRIRSTENVRFQTEWIISKNMSVQVCDDLALHSLTHTTYIFVIEILTAF